MEKRAIPRIMPGLHRELIPRGAGTAERLRHYFVTGLATLFPISVTLYLFLIIFQFADGLLGRFVNQYWQRAYGYKIPGLGLLLTVLLIMATGMFASHFLGRWLFRTFEEWLVRLPLIRRVYPSVKQLGELVFAKEGQQAAFRRVVLVEFPRPHCYSIAFVTKETSSSPDLVGRALLTLMVPTPPSPLTGPIIFVPKDDVIPLALSVEDAFKLVLSGGVVSPTLAQSSHGSSPTSTEQGL